MRTILKALVPAAMLFAAAYGCSDESSYEKRVYRSVPKAEYTREDPDQWKGLEEEHLPVVTINRDSDPDISVRVNLKKPGGDHYIEKIGIMGPDKKVYALKTFNRYQTIYTAGFSSRGLPSDTAGMKVFARCSLHSLWTVPLETR
jgi:desulfoferrodoxin (superoxide reductase-like protein)